MIQFVDIAPTFLDAAGIGVPEAMSGSSIVPVLTSNESGIVDKNRKYAFSGRERHTDARFDNVGYPARAVYHQNFAYIKNFKPERYPAGDPPNFYDIDGSPSKDVLLNGLNDPAIKPFFEMACGIHPAEELFELRKDPGCIHNLANDENYSDIKAVLRSQLEQTLRDQKDPRIFGSEIFDSYPRVSATRPELGGFHERGKYNSKYR
jgi:uncharacterized sulfatase